MGLAGAPPGGGPAAARWRWATPAVGEQRSLGRALTLVMDFLASCSPSAQAADHGRAGRPATAGCSTPPLPIRVLTAQEGGAWAHGPRVPALGEQLASWSRGVASGRISYNAGWVAVPCRAGRGSPEPHRLHVSAHGGAAAASLVAGSGGGRAAPC